MRVTSSATYRNYTNSVNDVHSSLNKSMNKVTTGKAYESAADNPLAYYEGKKIDDQYQDILSKLSLTTDVKTVCISRSWAPVRYRPPYLKQR